MKCPYCNEEMEAGYIKSNRQMRWGTEKKLGFVGKDIKLYKGFSDALAGMAEGFFVDSYCCRKCKKIIVSFD